MIGDGGPPESARAAAKTAQDLQVKNSIKEVHANDVIKGLVEKMIADQMFEGNPTIIDNSATAAILSTFAMKIGSVLTASTTHNTADMTQGLILTMLSAFEVHLSIDLSDIKKAIKVPNVYADATQQVVRFYGKPDMSLSASIIGALPAAQGGEGLPSISVASALSAGSLGAVPGSGSNLSGF
eukprot:2320404-Amphidinium_carterae.1